MTNVCQWCGKDYEGAPPQCPHCHVPIMRTLTHMRRPSLTTPAPIPAPPEVAPEPDPPAPAVEVPRPHGLRKAADPPGPAMPSPTPRPAMPSPTFRKPAAPSPPPGPAPASAAGREAFRTQAFGGIDISNLNIAKQNYTIEVFDNQQRWAPLFSMIGTGRKAFGREAGSGLESLKSLSPRHVQFDNNSRGLTVKPGRSLNGVYRRLRAPVALVDGLSFRIANYIMTFREAAPPDDSTRLVAEGEHLLARDLWALGYLEFLRPDLTPGVRYPILNPAATVLGRGGTSPDDAANRVDLPLLDDLKVSRRHAQITGRGRDDVRLTLSDLDSGTGTWVKITEPTLAEDGDEFWLGEIVLRVVASN